MNEIVTIVTGFVDIGRGEWTGQKNGRQLHPEFKRTTDTYFQRFERLTKLSNPIICFTESRFFDKIKSIRDDVVLVSIDSLFQDHKNLYDKISNIQNSLDYISLINTPECPEYWSPEYVIINAMKSHFVEFAIKSNFCKTNTTAWIDFGYLRDDSPYDQGMTWKFNTQNKINLFANFDNLEFLWTMPIFKAIMTNQVFIRGCQIVAPNDQWILFRKMIDNAIHSLLNVDLIDDDQTYLLMAYRSDPSKFIIHPAISNNWFTIFKDYNHCD